MGAALDVTVVVATFGGPEWQDLARTRAVPSAQALGVPVVHVHAGSLHEARNAGLRQVATEWVCHLDADDELEPGFFDAIAAASADVRAPAVRYIRPGWQWAPAQMPQVSGHDHACTADCLPWGNWLVIGSVVRAGLAQQVPFEDHELYEDWAWYLGLRAVGATFEAVPAAVYRAHVRPGSRNRAPDQPSRLEAHRAIARRHGVPVP